MPRSTLAGHPLHPQLVTLPLGMLPLAFTLDMIGVAKRDHEFHNAAYYALVGATATALAAATAGAMDYFAIPSRTKEKRIANIHALLNVGAVAMMTTNIALRRNRRRPPLASLILGGLTGIGMFISGWYGGHLVYSHGLRVKGKMELLHAREVKPAGDETLHEGFEAIEDRLPDVGPEERAS